MGVQKLLLVFCDICGTTYADGGAKTIPVSMQRTEYTADGWIFRNGKDYCPDCEELINNNKEIKENHANEKTTKNSKTKSRAKVANR